jgi:YD repeat-containing protein
MLAARSGSFQLDGFGKAPQAFDAYSNKIAQNYYDSRELLEKSTDAVGQVINPAYDPRGALVTSTDALGNTTRFAYDPLNRLNQVTSALSTVTAQGHDQDAFQIEIIVSRRQRRNARGLARKIKDCRLCTKSYSNTV